MTAEFISLAVVALIAALAPVIARITPRQIIPETVLLIIAGALLGPTMIGIIASDEDALTLLSDLGCAFLFLLAGYEIDPKSLSGSDGKHGLATWAATIGIAIVYSLILPQVARGPQGLAAASLLFTTTALGALMPILKERNLSGTPVGNLVISYGTWGKLGPVLAMAVLLSTRSTLQTTVILLTFAAVCLIIAACGRRARTSSTRLYRFFQMKADSKSQTMMRLAILMLIVLVTFFSIFDLDIVLGAFAAGFVMRFLPPDGAPGLESKLNGMAYGFFVPQTHRQRTCAREYRQFSARRVHDSIATIDNPTEREEAIQLVKRHISQTRKLALSQRDEIVKLYRRYHEGNLPDMQQRLEMMEHLIDEEKHHETGT